MTSFNTPIYPNDIKTTTSQYNATTLGMTTTEITPATEISTMQLGNIGTTIRDTTTLDTTTVSSRTTVEQKTIPTTTETTVMPTTTTEKPTTTETMTTTDKATTLELEARAEVTNEPSTTPMITTVEQKTTADLTSTPKLTTTIAPYTTVVETTVTTEKIEETTTEEVTTTMESTMMEETTLPMTTEASKKKKRSLVDYYIARYYDDRDITSFHLPHFPRRERDPSSDINYSFLVNGKFEETGVHFMTYDVVLPFYYVRNLNSLALKFPLDSPKYYLLLILPVDTYGIHKLVCDIDTTISLKEIVLQMRPTFVRAVIPSFMLRGFVVLTSTLQKVSHCCAILLFICIVNY